MKRAGFGAGPEPGRHTSLREEGLLQRSGKIGERLTKRLEKRWNTKIERIWKGRMWACTNCISTKPGYKN